MFSRIQRSLRLFTRSERLELFWVFVSVLLAAILEVVGIASVIPFLSVVSDPTQIQDQRVLRILWGLACASENEVERSFVEGA